MVPTLSQKAKVAFGAIAVVYLIGVGRTAVSGGDPIEALGVTLLSLLVFYFLLYCVDRVVLAFVGGYSSGVASDAEV